MTFGIPGKKVQCSDRANGSGAVSNRLRPMPLGVLSRLPLVSVLVSNYNYEAFLAEALDSVLRQSYSNFELILCDDGSTDNSRKIAESYQLRDPRIVAIYQRNAGQAVALNAAFSRATGEIICLLDADDLFFPQKLHAVVNAFVESPESGFVVHRMLRVDRMRQRLGEIPAVSRLPEGWCGAALDLRGPRMLPGMPPCSGLSLRRSVAHAIFPLSVDLRAYADMVVQILAPMMTPVVAIDQILGEYRVHGGNNGGKKQITAGHLANLITYEDAMWSAWCKHLTSISSQGASNFALRFDAAPSMMEYAHARFTGAPNQRSLYRAGVNGPRYRGMPLIYRWFWKMSIILPDWAFRESISFIYGQTRAKIIVGLAAESVRRLKRWFYRLFSAPGTRAAPKTEIHDVASSVKDNV